MESFKQFLETASINGLNHISSTRKWTRLFWINLVALGFVASTILIWESFQSWTENPIRTTTKTVPIKEIKFPKLTVCPPKNTFTDLNYDLMLAEEVTISNEERNELYEYVVELIDEHVYMDPWDKLHEENRFINWYKGFTSMPSGTAEPHYTGDALAAGGVYYTYSIDTSAPSGVITSQYFGEKYNPNLVEDRLQYHIRVWPFKSIRYNENVTLHFKIERLSFPQSGSSYDNFYLPSSLMEEKQKFLNESFSPPAGGDPKSAGSYNLVGDFCRTDSSNENDPCKDSQTWHRMENDLCRKFWNFRKISAKERSEANLQMVPGFRVSWNYSGIDINQEPLFEYPVRFKNWTVQYKDNKEFIREANKNIYHILSLTCFINFLDL